MSKNKNLSGGLFAAKPTPLAIRETSLSNQIAEHLNYRSIYNDRLQCGKIQTMCGDWIHLCKYGTPDRFAIVRGRIIFIEVKRTDGRLSVNQIERHHLIRLSGAIILVVNSFDDFVSKFNAIRAAIENKAREANLYD